MSIRFFFAWYDFIVGLHYKKWERQLYVFLIPCVGVRIQFGEPRDKDEPDKCEGCRAVATRTDSDGVPLCDACWHTCLVGEEVDDEDDEPVQPGSCDSCGVDVDDVFIVGDQVLCEQCAWKVEQCAPVVVASAGEETNDGE